jgi:hypothetical protein
MKPIKALLLTAAFAAGCADNPPASETAESRAYREGANCLLDYDLKLVASTNKSLTSQLHENRPQAEKAALCLSFRKDGTLVAAGPR